MEIRAFLGIPIPSDIRREVTKIVIEPLKKEIKNVKWVEEKNLHITLKFLGNIDDKKVKEVKNIMEGIVKKVSKFKAGLEGIGAFPSLSRARVIWIGIKEGEDDFKSLNKMIEKATTPLGFKNEHHRFTPHLTIGRLRIPTGVSLKIPYRSRIFLVDKFILYRSELSSQGPKYFSLAEFYLK